MRCLRRVKTSSFRSPYHSLTPSFFPSQHPKGGKKRGGRNLFHYSEVRLFARLLPQRHEKVVAKWNKSCLVKMRVEFHLKRPLRQDVVCEMRGCLRSDGESNSSLATGAVTRYSPHSLAVVADAVCFLKGEGRTRRTDSRGQERGRHGTPLPKV